jgi:hypothetical protein
MVTERRESLWAGGLMALATLVLVPVFWQGLPCSDDTLPHFFRAVQLDANLRQGAPFLQWGPDLLRGYGYPIFAFYAPLTYWLLQAIHLLGADFGPALQIAFVLALWLAGWGAYILARRYLAPPGAFVAGLAYLFAPYVLYDAIQRGALPELLALALLPWALAATARAQERGARTILPAAFLLGLLILAHNVVSIFGLALVLALALADLPVGARTAGQRRLAAIWQSLWPPLAAVILALGLTAFFWLPALAELSYTQSRRPDPPIRDWPRFDQHLAPPASILAVPVEPADPALLNLSITRGVGIGQATLALLALPWLLGRPHLWRRQLAVWALVALVSLFFTSTLSFWWWENLAPLRFIQLPTRFLAPASLAVALLAGAAADGLVRHGRRRASASLLLAISVLAVSLSGWPWLYPQYCPVPARPDQATLAQATTWERWYAEAQAELLPRWVDELPPADALIAAYQAGQTVDRLVQPPSVERIAWESGPGWDRYQLQLPAETTLLYQSFYFPGWQVEVDGGTQPVSITPPHGLISFSLPAGEHTVTIAFHRTPLRSASLLASGLFLLAALALARRLPPGLPPQPAPSVALVPRRALLLLALLLPLLRAGLVDRLDTPLRASRFDGARLQGVTVPAEITFDGELRYLGYSAPEEVVSGGRFSLTQYWSALRPLGVPYGFSVRVADDAGNVWSREPQRPFGYAGYPVTFNWQVGQYARDAYEITLLPGTSPGDYWIEVAAFRRDTDWSLIPQGAATGPDPAQARVGHIRVQPPRTPVDPDALDADSAAVAVYRPLTPGPVELLGWSLPGISIRSGEQIPLTLLWLAPAARPDDGTTFTLSLLDETGDVVAADSFSYGTPTYPPSRWVPGTLVRQLLNWRVPPAVPSGQYTVQLEGQPLGAVLVEAPQRTFTPQAMTGLSNVEMDIARLAGFTLSGEPLIPGAALPVNLLWQAVAETEISYRVFVHLRDSAGAIHAQSDGVPASWTRPTTGWLPGEYILETHQLHLPQDLPPGAYDVVAGLYDPTTGERLGEARLTSVNVE